MEPRTLHALELTGAIVGQTVLLVAAWSFLSAVFAADPLTVSDSLANLIHSKPTETTWIVTLVAMKSMADERQKPCLRSR